METDHRPEPEQQELTPAARRRSRVNALAVLAMFLLISLAPTPWNMFAPALIAVPALYGIWSRYRERQDAGGQPQPWEPVREQDGTIPDPYSYTPKDPNDPRRYKPIG